jgi:hypothetical protein
MTIVPLVVGYFAIQWNRANFMGKSPEQIVAMGREKWAELYGKKFGESTVQVCQAQEKYGFALQNLNDRAIIRLPKTRQVWSQEYAVEAHEIGSIVTGGGTMWQTFNSTILPDVEQAISDCIVNKPIPVVRMKSFESQFLTLDKIIAEAKGSHSISEYSGLLKHRSNLASKHLKLTSLLERGRQPDATKVQMYMHRKIEVASGDNFS